jgi:hypothetical protein
MPSDLLAPLLDPTAPLPAFWPTGMWGAFLLFLMPIGGGIPMGVLMGRDAGVSPLMLAGMYFVSDIFMAVTHEPMFWVMAWLARVFPPLGKVRDFFARASHGAGLRDEGARGPLGLILFSFTVDPISGRGAAAAAGHGFIMGWAFAIAGDMIYFAVLMAATLWLSGILGGDEHTTVGVVLLSVWGLSWYIRRRIQQRASEPVSAPAPAVLHVSDAGFSEPAGRRPALLSTAADTELPAASATTTTTGIRRYDTRPPRKKAGRKRR